MPKFKVTGQFAYSVFEADSEDEIRERLAVGRENARPIIESVVASLPEGDQREAAELAARALSDTNYEIEQVADDTPLGVGALPHTIELLRDPTGQYGKVL